MNVETRNPSMDVADRWERIWGHRTELLRLARSRVPSQSDAEDVVHEALTLAAADPNVELDRAGAWLNRVVRNRCADLARERSYADKRVIYEEGRARVQPLTEDVVCDLAEARYLSRVLSDLPSRQHEALVHASEGLTNAQIAAAMSTTVKAIESLLVKARRTLRTAAAAAVAGLAYLVRRAPRSATSSVSLAALTIGLAVYALQPSTPGAVSQQRHIGIRTDNVSTRVQGPRPPLSPRVRPDAGRVPAVPRPPGRPTVTVKPHHRTVEVKAGPSDTKVSVHQHGPLTNPVPDAVKCLRDGVAVSASYVGCRTSPEHH
jgi:RNA polymerase sigma factor (sigma-70 family)